MVAAALGRILDHELPAFAASLSREDPAFAVRCASDGALSRALDEARRALLRYATFLDDVCRPAAEPATGLGEQEVCFQLSETMGIPDSPQALVDAARARLGQVQQQLLDAASVVEGAPVLSLGAAREVVARVQGPRPGSLDEVLDLYRSHVSRAAELVDRIAPGLLPPGWSVHVAPAPPGLPYAANWPAPLLDPGRGGCFFVPPDPQGHPLAWAASLAVHEAIPGHYLQSAAWQARFSTASAPVRCLFMSDPVAIAHGFWGAMTNIEGWAVHAEGWMGRAGLYTPDEALCALVSDAIRFARVIADLSLQCGWMTDVEATEVLASACCVSPAMAAGEVARYRRIPLQSVTYGVGLLGLEALLEERTASHGERPLGETYAWWLDQGPVPPADLQRR